MIVFSSLQIRRGTRVLLDNATATINPGQKVGLVGKNGCGKSTLLSLLKKELSADAGSVSLPANWAMAWVNQETPALDVPALEYVIDGDREYRQLESELLVANEKNDGHAIATLHGKLDTINAWTIRARAANLLSGLGFSQPQLTQPVRAFSGGSGACALISRKPCCAGLICCCWTSRPTIWIWMRSSGWKSG
ncbi:ATP-binding cassette domain-containing protein [Candidatus Sodalis pierantonius]|uniref:ATP-binding cassette domain-containing protein n=1 Tax=Candidatus Sodalis pierantonii TaxID=1486991 RepID=UPI00046CB063|nr:ATP-binding cassette domain-containing protein [Candidatus Sodalis pierantonius]